MASAVQLDEAVIVYRSDGQAADARERLEAVAASCDARGLEAARDRLIELGVVEAAIADARHPVRDDADAVDAGLRAAAEAAGRALVAAVDGDAAAEAEAAARCRQLLGAVDRAALPARVEERPPEGYVHYGLYPECYVAAARQALAALRPRRAVCVGLRSIGTSLSAAVAAALAAARVAARSFTVRPRGDPFARQLRLGPALARALADGGDAALYLVCDEGPGLSGSSFAAAADALVAAGVPPERVVLLPSHDADPARLANAEARRAWRRHRRFVAAFDPRLVGDGLDDLSAGRWRARLFADERDWPPAQPQHERRKYLGGGRLYKFAGFGRFGAARVARARALADAGFGPPIAGFAHGFVAHPWLGARPLGRAGAARHVARIAAYLAHRRRFVAAARVDAAALVAMTAANAAELCGRAAAARVDGWARRAQAAGERARIPAVELDARLQPVEWLDADPPLKLDAVDHGVGHFHPGPHDRAWDVAGAVVELVDGGDAAALVAALTRDDPTLPERLPFYEAAYLAWHAGYATLAAATTDGAEAGRWSRAAAAYRARLARHVGA